MTLRRLVPAFLLLLLGVAPSAVAQQMEIHLLDVGQGDATVIVTPRGKTVLIDAGPKPDYVANLLAQDGIDTLDLVIASHNHADHIGGMAAVLRRSAVKYYLSNDVPSTTVTYRQVRERLSASNTVYLQPNARTITVDSVRFRVLPAAASAKKDDQNNRSVGILVEYRGFSALFTGDSETSELEHWLRFDSIPRVDVIKVAHHGSINGTTAAWAGRTRPAVAVVSVGMNNGYGHPSAGVMKTWGANAQKVFRTDRDGSVAVTVEETGEFTVETKRGAVCRTDPAASIAREDGSRDVTIHCR